MRISTIEHVPFEDPAAIIPWAAARGHVLERTLLHAGHPLPDPSSFDLLVVMGGPMSVHDEPEFSWLAAEKDCIKAAVARGRGVFGVCLGAQLLAQALGAAVTRNPEREIGWHEVELTPWGRSSPVFAGLPARFTPFHWHGETFGLPRGAVAAASSRACANQAFAVGGRLAGVQFHLETSLASMENLIEHAADDLQPGRWVQPPERMRQEAARHLPALESLLHKLLDTIAKEL